MIEHCGRLATWWHRRLRNIDWYTRTIAMVRAHRQGISDENFEVGWQYWIRHKWHWHCPCAKEFEAQLAQEDAELTKSS